MVFLRNVALFCSRIIGKKTQILNLRLLTRTSRKRFTAESQRAPSLRGFLRELSVSAVQKFLPLCEKQAFNF